jgi:hypothetical protein
MTKLINKNSIILVVLILIACGKSYAQDEPFIVDCPKGINVTKKMFSIAEREVTIGTVFTELIRNHCVSVGFEYSSTNLSRTEFEFRVSPTFNGYPKATKGKSTIVGNFSKIEFLLNMMVSEMPGYKWEINDETVNFVPIKDRDAEIQELLNFKINKFHIEKDADSSTLREKLKSAVKSKTDVVFNPQIISDSRDYKMREELNLSDITLKELLNKISKMKLGGWVIRRTDKNIEILI